jgi:hypothetical protein
MMKMFGKGPKGMRGKGPQLPTMDLGETKTWP